MERLDETQPRVRQVNEWKPQAAELLLQMARSCTNRYVSAQYKRAAQTLLKGRTLPVLPRRNPVRLYHDAFFIAKDGTTWLDRLEKRHYFVMTALTSGPALFRRIGWIWPKKVLLYEEYEVVSKLSRRR